MPGPNDHTPDKRGPAEADSAAQNDQVDQGRPAKRRGRRRHRAAERTIAVLPTLCTLGNCLCGFLALFFATRTVDLWDWTPLTVGGMFVFLGMIFDGLDGRLARLTRQTSKLGGQLDSMADMVTFGVAPAFLAVQMIIDEQAPFIGSVDRIVDRATLVIACIFVACAALRLARFNLQTEGEDLPSHMSFEGLPTPGAAGTVVSMVLLQQDLMNRLGPDHVLISTADVVMVATMGLVAVGMVSRLPYVHLVNRYLRERARIEYVAILVAGVLLVFTVMQEALAAGFVLYAISAPIAWAIRRMRQRRLADD